MSSYVSAPCKNGCVKNGFTSLTLLLALLFLSHYKVTTRSCISQITMYERTHLFVKINRVRRSKYWNTMNSKLLTPPPQRTTNHISETSKAKRIQRKAAFNNRPAQVRHLGVKHCGSQLGGKLTFSMGKSPSKPNGTVLWCTTDISVSYLGQAHGTKEMMGKIAPWIPCHGKRKSWKTRQIKEMAIKTTRKSLRPVRATKSHCDNWQEILRGRDPMSCNQTAWALVKTER